MAGHFLLADFPQDIWEPLGQLTPTGFASGPEHKEIGWTPASRQYLQDAINGANQITNRSGLPPHWYISISANKLSDLHLQAWLLQEAWVNNLTRPPKMFLCNLCQTAKTEWDAGRRANAVIQQNLHGNVSIEVYTVQGEEGWC